MTEQRKEQKEGEHMLQATEFLRLMRFITKSHEACIQTICSEHQLTMMEATIMESWCSLQMLWMHAS